MVYKAQMVQILANVLFLPLMWITSSQLYFLFCFVNFCHLSVIDQFFLAMTEIFLVIMTKNFFTTANTGIAGSKHYEEMSKNKTSCC